MKKPKPTMPIDNSRREFIKLMGFSAGVTALLPACQQPVRKMIPFLIQPEEVIPGKAFHYATTFSRGNFICPVVVKSRDGRPIKIEGNELSSITAGGTNAAVQASILDLYHPARLNAPISGLNVSNWDDAYQFITEKLNLLSNKKVVIVSETISSPSAKEVIRKFITKSQNIEHLEIDAISHEAIRLANQKSFGKYSIPDYHFEKIKLLVGLNCDFLGAWISPVEFSKKYASRKNPDKNLIRHIQFESTFTTTGGAADKRIAINPSDETEILKSIYAELTGKNRKLNGEYYQDIKILAEELRSNKGESVILSGSNNIENQMLVNAINFELQNIGTIIDFTKTYCTFQGKGKNLENLIEGLKNKTISGALFYQFDPLYFSDIKSQLKNLELSVYLGTMPPTEATVFNYVLPVNHYLESWSDAEIKTGSYSLGQPLIQPLFDTRQAEDVLLNWCGETISFHDFLKSNWENSIYPSLSTTTLFTDFWNETLQKGIFEKEVPSETSEIKFSEFIFPEEKSTKEISVEVHLFESSIFGNGNQGENPWLLELPDPATKQCWGNSAIISQELAEKYLLGNGEHILITYENKEIEIPVLILTGQAENTVSIALGFGRENTFKHESGVNVFPFVDLKNGLQQYSFQASIKKTERLTEPALGQIHTSQENRELIRILNSNEIPVKPRKKNSHIEEYPVFYETAEFPGYHWGLVVDLNKCTGCSTCVVACQSENNIPVVGKTEVIRKHEMHWLRLDRYFEKTDNELKMLVQPVMCQQCDYAPCENVCPVSATTHSSEGLNQMVYNRCIGTRYCANNCPYKVRRFNWFDYNKSDVYKNNEMAVKGMDSELVRMVFNPDVTVRSRGVIEKCSFCIQRIIEAKNNAKLENRPVADGEIKMACEQACPSDALLFGDLNNPESRISKIMADTRNYRLLEDLSTQPSVYYQVKIINKPKA